MFIQLLKKVPKILKKSTTTHILLGMLGLFLIHATLISYFEKWNFGDAIWFSFTTATTVGYGDFSPVTAEGRIITVLLMYAVGIYLMAAVVGAIFSKIQQKQVRKKMGLRNLSSMCNHIILTNIPRKNTISYIKTLHKEFEAESKTNRCGIVILDTIFEDKGIPEALSEIGIKYYNGLSTDKEALLAAGAKTAADIVIFGDPDNVDSDSRVLHTLHLLKEIETCATIVCEYAKLENKNTLKDADILLRQVRAYPEMLVRAIAHPGVEDIFENLFEISGNRIESTPFALHSLTTWEDIVFKFVRENKGIPIAVKNQGGSIIMNPKHDMIMKNCIIYSIK